MEEKKYFLGIALSCLRKKDETDPFLKIANEGKPLPTEKELKEIEHGMNTGEISDTLLKKFWSPAYKGVTTQGFFDYCFFGHNEKLCSMPRIGMMPKLSQWCKIDICRIKKKTENGYLVEDSHGNETETKVFSYGNIKSVDEKYIHEGSYVARHRGSIGMILDGILDKAVSACLKGRNDK